MNTQRNETAELLVQLASMAGADILMDGLTKTVHSFNEKARDWVDANKPKTQSAATFVAMACGAGLAVWAAIAEETETTIEVKFGPVNADGKLH